MVRVCEQMCWVITNILNDQKQIEKFVHKCLKFCWFFSVQHIYNISAFDLPFIFLTALICEGVNETTFLKSLYSVPSINISGLLEAFIRNLRYCKWTSYWLITAIWYWRLVADIEEIQMSSALDTGIRFILHTTNTPQHCS